MGKMGMKAAWLNIIIAMIVRDRGISPSLIQPVHDDFFNDLVIEDNWIIFIYKVAGEFLNNKEANRESTGKSCHEIAMNMETMEVLK